MNNRCQTSLPPTAIECGNAFSRSGSFKIIKAKDIPTSFLLEIIEEFRNTGGHIVLERCPFDFNTEVIPEYNYSIYLNELRFEVQIEFV